MRKLAAILLVVGFLTATNAVFADASPTHSAIPSSPEKQLKFFEGLAKKRIEEAKRLKIFEKVVEIFILERRGRLNVSEEFVFEYCESLDKIRSGKPYSKKVAAIFYKKEMVFYAVKRSDAFDDIDILIYRPNAVWLDKMEDLFQKAKNKKIFEKIRDLKSRYDL